MMACGKRWGLKCAEFAFLKLFCWPRSSSGMYTRHTRELESKAIKKAIALPKGHHSAVGKEPCRCCGTVSARWS